jgi:hypothetical protein
MVEAPSPTEPQPHPLATIAWNNLNPGNCCLQMVMRER